MTGRRRKSIAAFGMTIVERRVIDDCRLAEQDDTAERIDDFE